MLAAVTRTVATKAATTRAVASPATVGGVVVGAVDAIGTGRAIRITVVRMEMHRQAKALPTASSWSIRSARDC